MCFKQMFPGSKIRGNNQIVKMYNVFCRILVVVWPFDGLKKELDI